MTKHRYFLPQLDDILFLTDGGIETTLIFHEGLDLPYFAAFHLLQTAEGTAALRRYFRPYLELAHQYGTGLVLESATWRASADWGAQLGYTAEALAEANQKAIDLLADMRREYETDDTPIVISGCVGPRGDGYVPDQVMSAAAAQAYHQAQINTFAETDADMICAITMNYVEEAIGIVRAAQQAEMPVTISFTVETDGYLPTGQSLQEAIEQVDRETASYPVYYMINCAHPSHFEAVLAEEEAWTDRIRGLRANASRMSHAELNEAPELDMGNPAELGEEYARLKMHFGQINVLGGCCGTDHRHVEEMAAACVPFYAVPAWS
jgi:homocysteine S-methyltransferase